MSQYRSNRFNHRPKRNFSRGVKGAKRVKSFDPTSFIQQNNTTQPRSKPYEVVHSFADFKISEALKRNIASKGYTQPTPIQDQAIPLILEGKDVIGIANTGTGKTAAFVIPLLNEITKNRHKKILIITPTRELAVQIRNECFSFARGMNIQTATCIGGVNSYQQKSELRRNPNIVIGTPGRLKDLIQQRSLQLSTFNSIVLDEVDQMVDFGFITDIKFIISYLAHERQSLFFSATINGKVKDVLSHFVRNPIMISVKKQDSLENITQDVIKIVDKSRKIDRLHDLLIKKEFEKVLIFGRTKFGVQRLTEELVKRGFHADVIHGNKRQSQRQRTLNRFKRNDISILLATDVASRGLDIDNVSHVINYDPPESYEVYIHRIGRTGRGDKQGTAITFL
ncbi:DEAD/DEAH box helicase [Candidatus Woesebacteria bacterium]|nr:DEAD/DEAH box helicase [Candidatus Woesebacteria bacterium]